MKPFSDPDKQIVPRTGSDELGLTRRELLISHALQGLLSMQSYESADCFTDEKFRATIARAAIKMADTVIKEAQK